MTEQAVQRLGSQPPYDVGEALCRDHQGNTMLAAFLRRGDDGTGGFAGTTLWSEPLRLVDNDEAGLLQILRQLHHRMKLRFAYYMNYLALQKKNSRNMMLSIFATQSSFKSIQRKENSTSGPNSLVQRPREEDSTHRQTHQVNNGQTLLKARYLGAYTPRPVRTAASCLNG
ncbi:MAG: hypothetical protein ACTHNH_23570 [Mesorhizobium sp.]